MGEETRKTRVLLRYSPDARWEGEGLETGQSDPVTQPNFKAFLTSRKLGPSDLVLPSVFSKNIKFLSCFFPAYNEGANLPMLLDEALVVLHRFADSFEVIVVDDGSTDDTAQVVHRYALHHHEVRLESHPTNLGYGHALQTGLRASKGDVVFFTDGDRQFRLSDIELMLPAFQSADIVAGYRVGRTDPRRRVFVTWVYGKVLRLAFGTKFKDVDCAFKLIRRKVLDDVLDDMQSRSAFISPELLIRARLADHPIAEVGIPHHPRTAGRPKGATPKVIARTLKEIFEMRSKLKAPQPSPSLPLRRSERGYHRQGLR